MEYIVFNTTTGHIVNRITSYENDPLNNEVFTGFSFIPNLSGVWVDDSMIMDLNSLTIVTKPTLTVTFDSAVPADGTTVANITAIPSGTTMIFDGQRYALADTFVEVTFDLAGDYDFRFENELYLPLEITINAY